MESKVECTPFPFDQAPAPFDELESLELDRLDKAREDVSSGSRSLEAARDAFPDPAWERVLGELAAIFERLEEKRAGVLARFRL